MPELLDMPIEIAVEIFSLLDHSHAQNLRLSCKPLDAVYQDHRLRMRGPEIDVVSIYYHDNIFDILIKGCSRGSEWKSVVIEDWNMHFGYAEVNHMDIEAPQLLPMDLSRKMGFCKSIKELKYYGDMINQHWLDTFDQLVNDFSVVVDKWPVNLVGSTKMEFLHIFSPILNFHHVSKVINFVPEFFWYMKPEAFDTAIEVLKTFQTGQLDIELWSVMNETEEYERTDPVVMEFVRQIKRVSKNTLQAEICEDYIILQKN